MLQSYTSGAVCLLLVLIVPILGCRMGSDNSDENYKPSFSATIFPIYDIARQIVSPHMDVALILPPGESPHTFNPNPRLKNAVDASDRIFVIGNRLDEWALQLVDDQSKVVPVDSGSELLEWENHDETEDHGHGNYDPHYWLNPENAIPIATIITEQAVLIDPEHWEYYSLRLDNFILSIQQLYLDGFSRSRIIADKPFVTLHSGWTYFSDAFQLNALGSFYSVGSQATPKYLHQLGNLIDTHNVKVIFSEPQLSTSAINSIVEDRDLIIGMLDPLGGSGDITSYQLLIDANINALIKNLSD